MSMYACLDVWMCGWMYVLEQTCLRHIEAMRRPCSRPGSASLERDTGQEEPAACHCVRAGFLQLPVSFESQAGLSLETVWKVLEQYLCEIRSQDDVKTLRTSSASRSAAHNLLLPRKREHKPSTSPQMQPAALRKLQPSVDSKHLRPELCISANSLLASAGPSTSKEK